jgi:hypothetical protein
LTQLAEALLIENSEEEDQLMEQKGRNFQGNSGKLTHHLYLKKMKNLKSGKKKKKKRQKRERSTNLIEISTKTPKEISLIPRRSLV